MLLPSLVLCSVLNTESKKRMIENIQVPNHGSAGHCFSQVPDSKWNLSNFNAILCYSAFPKGAEARAEHIQWMLTTSMQTFLTSIHAL